MCLLINALKKRHAVIFNLVLGVILVFASAGTAYACKCVKQTLKKHYQSANAVVTARVVEVIEKDENVTEVKLQISDSWKSSVAENLVIITGKTTCDFTMRVDEEYLLYLKKLDSGEWTTNVCMGNMPKNKAANAGRWLKLYGKKTVAASVKPSR